MVAAGVLAVEALHAQPSSSNVVERMRAYLDQFVAVQPTLIAEEIYDQNRTAPRQPPERRRLRSEVLMLKLPGSAGWVSFRDVIDVDGRPIDDRQGRLLELLQAPAADVVNQARRIESESARYNLGQVTRTTNVPDTALRYLQRDFAKRVTIDVGKETEEVDGVDTAILVFRETGRPTAVRTPDGRNVPAQGRAWVDRDSGVILRTEIRLRDRNVEALCTVDFSLDARLGVRIPARMTEHYAGPREYVAATARYQNIRQFTVTATETVRRPPGQ